MREFTHVFVQNLMGCEACGKPKGSPHENDEAGAWERENHYAVYYLYADGMYYQMVFILG